MLRFAFAAVAGCGAAYSTSSPSPSAALCTAQAGAKPFTSKDDLFGPFFKNFKLGEVINLSSDTAIFRFLTPNADDVFCLEPCATLQAYFKTGGASVEQCQRFYTPITRNGEKGYFDIIARKYKHGRMTEHLFAMRVGESMQFRSIAYKLQYKPNKWKAIGAIGGGTGVTSLLQVVRANVENPEDKTEISMVFGNRNERKILLKGMIDDLVVQAGGKFKCKYVVDRFVGKPDEVDRSQFEVGTMDAKMLKKYLPAPTPDNLILICGPDGMMANLAGLQPGTLKAMSGGNALQPASVGMNNFADVGGVLAEMGYQTEQVYRF
jgi:cytochrome-b5 reductase